MYGVALVICLALIGGIIAVIGDRIGMRVGRRRLSLFGLRPRHTSAVVTVFTGVAVAAASLGLMSAASSDVRTALFHMRELKEDLAAARSNLNILTNRVEQREHLAENLARHIEALIRLKSEHAGDME